MAFAHKKNLVRNALKQINNFLRKNEPTKILGPLEAILRSIKSDFALAPRPEQIAYLENLPLAKLQTQALAGGCLPTSLPWLDEFLTTGGYAQIILAACPEIKCHELPEEILGRKQFYIYPHPKKSCTWDLKRYAPPTVGEYYWHAPDPKGLDDVSQLLRGRLRVYWWYERILPKILTKLGLKISKVSLQPLGPTEKLSGWEIIAGLEEFRVRPLSVF